ncbi:hypothetical protein, partial [Tenacibaculum dicentrarchi]
QHMRELTQIEINEFNLLLNTCNQISMRGIDEQWEKWILRNLPKYLPLFTHLVAFYDFKKLERITVNKRILGTNKRIRNIDFLKYPPAEKVNRYGRCNLKKESIFYGAPMITTALSEMRPKVGELVTKSIWKVKEKHTFKICPIFHIQPTNGTMNPHSFEMEQSFYEDVNKNFKGKTKEAVINLTKFIAFHFSKNVNPDNDRDYIFSAFFANKLLNELDGGTIEGILYPSVKEKLSFENVALKADVFDKYFEIDEVSESIVVKDPSDGGGGLLQYGLSHCKDFNNKEILWSTEINQPKERMDFYNKEFELDLT